MSSTAIPRSPAHRLVLADLVPNVAVRDAALVLAGALLVAASAQIYVVTPITPVPFTGQTFGVLLVGAGLGPKRGAIALLAYLALGAAGLPFYTEASGGLAPWVGPTAGYLAAFPIAAAIAGAASRRGWDRNPAGVVGAFAAGSAVIYLLGAGWLAVGIGMGVGGAITAGVLPFLVGDLLKAVLAAGLLPGAWWVVRRVRGEDDAEGSEAT